MTTTEVAQKLVDLCRQGKFEQAMNDLYGDDIVSVEPMAMPPNPAEVRGIAAVRAKSAWWVANHDIHSCTVGGPFIHGDNFVALFDLDVTFKPTGKRMQMSEAAVYTVANGKVTHEAFYYAAPPAK